MDIRSNTKQIHENDLIKYVNIFLYKYEKWLYLLALKWWHWKDQIVMLQSYSVICIKFWHSYHYNTRLIYR